MSGKTKPTSKLFVIATCLCSWICTTFPALGINSDLPKLVQQPAWNSCTFFSIAYSPDNRNIATGGDSEIMLWDRETGKLVRTMRGIKREVLSVAFSSDGNQLCSASMDNSLQLWNVRTGEKIRKFAGHQGGFTEWIGFSSDGTQMAAAFSKQRAIGKSLDYQFFSAVELYNVATGKLINRIEIPTRQVEPFAVSGNLKLMATGRGDGIKVWDLSTGKQLSQLENPFGKEGLEKNDIESVSLNFDGTRMVCGSDKGLIAVVSVNSGKTLQRFSACSSELKQALLSPDGKLIATACKDSTVRLWSAASGRQVSLVDNQTDTASPLLAFSADSRYLTNRKPIFRERIGPNQDHPTKIWFDSVNVFDVTRSQRAGLLQGQFSIIKSAVFSSDGKHIITSNEGDRCTVWNIAHSESPYTLNMREEPVLAKEIPSALTSVISHDGATTATADGAYLTLTKSSDRSAVTRIKVYEHARAVTTFNDLLHAYDEQGALESPDITSIVFSPDDTLVATVDNNRIDFWSVADGKHQSSLPGASVSFSKDGGVLAVVQNGSVNLLKALDHKLLATLSTFGGDDWTVVASNGEFDASNLDSIPTVAWVMPEEPTRAMPVELFFRQYYTPGLLTNLFSADGLPPVTAISALNLTQPEVKIESIKPSSAKPDEVQITVSCESISSHNSNSKVDRSGVYDLRLFRDGQLVGCLPESNTFTSNAHIDLCAAKQKFKKTFLVRLPHNGASKYQFTAYAFNSDQIKSATDTCEYDLQKPLKLTKGRAYVIAFGVNVFDDPSWNLDWAVADAKAFKSNLVPALQATERYKSVIPIQLTSDRSPPESGTLLATKQNLLDVFSFLSGHAPKNIEVKKLLQNLGVRRVDPEDSVIIAFSTHGAVEKSSEQFFLFPCDIGKKQSGELTSNLISHAISTSELEEAIKNIDAANITMIIDSCHSAAASGKDARGGPMNNSGLAQLAYYKRMRILAASSASTGAQENGDIGHGFLTYALLEEGLARDGRADTKPKDGKISMEEWLHFAQSEVPRLDELSWKGQLASAKSRDVHFADVDAQETRQLPVMFDFANQQSTDTVLDLSN